VRSAGSPPWLGQVAAFVLVLVLAVAGGVQAGARTGWNPGTIAMEVAVAIPLLWRTRHPLAVFAVVVTAALLGPRLAPDGGLTYAVFAAILLSAYTLGARVHRWLAGLAELAAAAVTIAVLTGGQPPPLPVGMLPAVVLGLTWLAGFNVRHRQRRADHFQDQARELAHRHQQATRAVADERAGIARELHDIVAHSVSVMVIQAGAARHKLPTSPQKATDALLAVESAGRDALAELRHLLGLLQASSQADTLQPQPGLDQVDILVQPVRAAGVPVTVTVRGCPRPVPAGIGLAAYRIIQEALTNVLKHAPQASAEVTIGYRERELAVQILNTPGTGQARQPEPASGGRGLIGMRERVGLYGGQLRTGNQPGGGYAVAASLPLPPAPA
jgi:signal transduction histidine kinase